VSKNIQLIPIRRIRNWTAHCPRATHVSREKTLKWGYPLWHQKELASSADTESNYQLTPSLKCEVYLELNLWRRHTQCTKIRKVF